MYTGGEGGGEEVLKTTCSCNGQGWKQLAHDCKRECRDSAAEDFRSMSSAVKPSKYSTAIPITKA